VENLFIGYQDGLVRATVNGHVDAQWVLRDTAVAAVVSDPLTPNRVYAATLGKGIWRSLDGGESFSRLSGLKPDLVWSIAVSSVDRPDGVGTIYAGTQMSALYRSTDGGDTWEELHSVQELPSIPEWAFPPAPDTHHVHQITLDNQDPDVIVFGVELGGVYHSADRGRTWTRTTADPDPHTLRTHPTASQHMYEGGGAAYYSSEDGGATWARRLDGIPDDVRYFFSLAVDSGDPGNVIISGARDPFSGHGVPLMEGEAWSSLYRLEGGTFVEVTDGLPDSQGTAMGTLVAGGPGVFYYLTEPGEIYRSTDGGRAFEHLDYGPSAAIGQGARSGYASSAWGA
jgi:BNR/Asp-box repeat